MLGENNMENNKSAKLSSKRVSYIIEKCCPTNFTADLTNGQIVKGDV